MIRWKLRQVMADRSMSNRALAEALNLHETTISNMKRRDDMPRIDGETLNLLCKALGCVPGDLIVYSQDEEKGDRPGSAHE